MPTNKRPKSPQAYLDAKASLGHFLVNDNQGPVLIIRLAYSNEPIIRTTHFRAVRLPSDGLEGLPWNGEKVRAESLGRGEYRGVGYLVRVVVYPGDPLVFEEEPYPVPMTKGQVRYFDRRWERLTKNGWIEVLEKEVVAMDKIDKVVALAKELAHAEQRAAELRKQLMEEVAAGVSRKATSPEGRVSPKEQELNVTAEERQAVQHAVQWLNAPIRGSLREKVLGAWILRGTKTRTHTQAFPGLSPAQVSGVMSALVRVRVAVRVKDGLWILNPELVEFLEQRGYV